MKLYGIKGRVISGISLAAGTLSALVASAQQAQLISIFPASYNKYFAGATIVSLFITAFAERLQGGASKPEVRAAAETSDRRNSL